MSARVAIGDAVVLGAATVVGFLTHGTIGDAGRVIVTITAFLAAWFWAELLTGAYRADTAVWRVVAAWSLAAPLGAALRALALGIPVTPIFVVVTIAVNGAAVGLWRLLARRFVTG